MKINSVFVTGGTSGVGLGFVKHFVSLPEPPKFVFASYRRLDTAQELEEVKNGAKETKVILIKMDVTNAEEITAARKIIESIMEEEGLTLLINNAAMSLPAPFPNVDEENMLVHYKANTVGPLMVFKEMLPLLKKSAARRPGGLSVQRACVINISSTAGSISEVETQPRAWLVVIGYRTSKTALNMAMRIAAITLKDEGILVVQMCPGHVKTRMTAQKGTLEVSESVSCMVQTLPKLDETHHGGFLDRNGELFPY